MSFLLWMAVLGVLLLILALASAYLRWLPVTSSLLYLACGLAIGPLGLNLWRDDFLDIVPWLEHLTEVAVLISLFIGGLKLRLPLHHPSWIKAWILAGPVLMLTIALGTWIGHQGLGFGLGAALLYAAILSPTDPVLASLVQVNHARDDDPLRFSLSGEAGLNDGMAFPFVVGALVLLGLGHQGPWEWALLSFAWAVPVALVLGFFLGNRVGRLAISARVRNADTAISANVFLGMALVSLSYVGAELLEAWGFLAAFAAGVGLRHAEIRSSGGSEVPAEEGTVLKAGLSDDGLPVSIEYGEDRREHRKIAAGTLIVDILSFGGLLERALEVVLVMLLGAALSACWDWRGVWLALALFCLVRPLACWVLLPRTGLDRWQRLLVGWFGVRGIGSLYYLCFALDHGLEGAAAREAMGISLTVVACSLLLHGLSTQPLLDLYEARQRRAGAGLSRR